MQEVTKKIVETMEVELVGLNMKMIREVFSMVQAECMSVHPIRSEKIKGNELCGIFLEPVRH